MRKLVEIKAIQKDGHHMFTYENGKKTPIPDDGIVFAYRTKSGMLKVSEYPDVASANGDGKVVITDEVGNHEGTPSVNGVGYNIWGIGADYVLISNREDKFYIGSADSNHVTTHPNKAVKVEAYKVLYNIYSMLI